MTETAYQRPLAVGEMIDVFRIERVLGAGGFGITYLATDTSLHCYVAVKEYFPQNAWREQHSRVIRANAGDANQSFHVGLDRFHREGQTLAQFNHLNIVKVRRLLQANGTAYLVMDYEQGETLESYLQRLGRPLSFQEVETIFNPLLDGLRAIHKRNLLHLDIKPANIFLRSDAIPVLIDFGGARHQLGQASHMVSFLVASDGYAPNEQYSGSQLQPATDIYAMAATIYYSITGKTPPDSPARANQSVKVGVYPPYFLQAVDAALSMPIANRPQSVRGFQQRLFTQIQPNIRQETAQHGTAYVQSPYVAQPIRQQRMQAGTNWTPILFGTGGIVILLLGIILVKMLQGSTDLTDPSNSPQVVSAAASDEAKQQAEAITQEAERQAKQQAEAITQEAERQAKQKLDEVNQMVADAAEVQRLAQLQAKEEELQQREAQLKQAEQQRIEQATSQQTVSPHHATTASSDASSWYQVEANPVLRIRSSPSESGGVIGKIPNGGKIKVLRAVSSVETVAGHTGQWVEVAYQNTLGYAFSGFLTPLASSSNSGSNATVSAQSGEWLRVKARPHLNIRSSPDVTGSVVTTVDNGKSVKVLERVSSQQSVSGTTGYWVKIEANGKIGFVFDAFLE